MLASISSDVPVTSTQVNPPPIEFIVIVLAVGTTDIPFPDIIFAVPSLFPDSVTTVATSPTFTPSIP